MTLDRTSIPGLLQSLHDALELEGADAVEWVVCGGTALALQGLTRRSTQDIDVLGEGRSGAEIKRIQEFSPAVERAIARTAAAHPELEGMGRRWVNASVSRLVDHGLPAGLADRLVTISIGPKLRLHLVARLDLIALKLLAAADDLGQRQAVHLADLESLQPTAAEIDLATQWVLALPLSDARLRAHLKSILTGLGHEDIAYYIEC